MTLTINFSSLKDGMVAALERMFFAYAEGPFRPCVREFFGGLAVLFELEGARRVAAPGVRVNKMGVELPMLADFTEAELITLRGAFCDWRDRFAQVNPPVGEFLCDLTCLLDDTLRERKTNAQKLQEIFTPSCVTDVFWDS